MQHLALISKQSPLLLSKDKTRLEQYPLVMETPMEESLQENFLQLVISNNFFKCIVKEEKMLLPRLG